MNLRLKLKFFKLWNNPRMELIIKNKKRNELLEREEIRALAKSEITPTMQKTKQAIAETLHANVELVVLERIKGNFGRKEFNVEACIYDNKEALEKTEPKPKAKKEKEKQEAKTEREEEKAEQKKEEKAEQKSSK